MRAANTLAPSGSSRPSSARVVSSIDRRTTAPHAVGLATKGAADGAGSDGAVHPATASARAIATAATGTRAPPADRSALTIRPHTGRSMPPAGAARQVLRIRYSNRTRCGRTLVFAVEPHPGPSVGGAGGSGDRDDEGRLSAETRGAMTEVRIPAPAPVVP